jgi:hypothetical protein
VQFVWRDAFEAPEQEWVIGEESIAIERRLSEVNKVAAAEPESFERGVFFGEVVREHTERVIGIEAEIRVAASKWGKCPSANQRAVCGTRVTLIMVNYHAAECQDRDRCADDEPLLEWCPSV